MGINIEKLAHTFTPILKKVDSAVAKEAVEELPQISEKSLSLFSNASASLGKAQIALMNSSAIKKVTTEAEKSEIPEFLYHLTSKSNYEKILKDKAINISDLESQSKNGLAGAYMLDKENFLKTWNRGCKEITNSENINIGGTLFGWCSKGDDLVLLKIPTNTLDKKSLRVRNYIDDCMSQIRGDGLASQGKPIEELTNLKNIKEPLEYVYMGKVPTEAMAVESVTPFNEETFGKLMYGDHDYVEDFSKKIFNEIS